MKISVLIPFLETNKKNIKVHCATGSIDKFAPKNEFLTGDFKKWQEEQRNKNFERKYILSLIYWEKDEWLFAGIYKRISVKEINKECKYKYETELQEHIAGEFIGKLIIHFKKDFRASYLKLENIIDKFELLEIKREKAKVEFPGYDKVDVSWKELEVLIHTPAWKTALENQKGVYLITDIATGKRYVGKASGEDMLLGRWENYINNGNGGNKELEKLDFENYIKENFRYSILEIFKSTTDDSIIDYRESWWKDVLLTRNKNFGYNDN